MPKRSELETLEASRADIERNMAIGIAELDRLEDARRGILLSGSDVELSKHDEAQAAAKRAIDRLNAQAEALDAKLADVRSRKASADAVSARNAAEAAVKKATEAVVQHFGEINCSAKALLKKLDELETIYAAGCNIGEPITPLPARIAALRRLPEQIVSEKTIQCWCFEGTNNKIADHHTVEKRGHGVGVIYPQSKMGSAKKNVELRSFLRREYLPAVDLGTKPLERTILEILAATDLSIKDTRRPEVELTPTEEVANDAAAA